MSMNRKRILDYGIRVGCLPTGPLDKITDVPGVTARWKPRLR